MKPRIKYNNEWWIISKVENNLIYLVSLNVNNQKRIII